MSTLYVHGMVCAVLLIYRHGYDFALFIDRIRIWNWVNLGGCILPSFI